MGEAVVQLIDVGKKYSGVPVLQDINLDIEAGTVHALVGENGAGKSTIGRIISGAIQPSSGELLVGGRVVRYGSPHAALSDGIVAVQQEIVLVPEVSVMRNVFLGMETSRLGLARDGEMREAFAQLNAESGFDLPRDELVSRLPLHVQQQVDILRALARKARVVIMDEPTAALGPEETSRLLRIVDGLRERGQAVIYITHFLDEALQISDRVTVLRNGRLIRTSRSKDETPRSLVSSMLGHTLDTVFPEKRLCAPESPVVLKVEQMTAHRGVTGFEDVSFEVRRGEIVALAGLVGSGRTEVARAIFGADRLDSGTVTLEGSAVRLKSPHSGVLAGIAMLPEDRKAAGLHQQLSVMANLSLAHLEKVAKWGFVVRPGQEKQRATELLDRLNIVPPRLDVNVESYSGGNQQKILFGKWLYAQPHLLIADEPTRGVDVAAKLAIYELIVQLAAEGMAVLLVSSEIEEVLGLAHRVLVMRTGRIVARLSGEAITESSIMHAAFGLDEAQSEGGVS